MDHLERDFKGAERTIRLYPWFKFGQSLLFWQATWFLYFQQELSGAEAILLYAVYDVATTVLEVPSGYMSDRIGRRLTLILSVVSGFGAMLLIATGDSFLAFAMGQILLGASMALMSGTDTSLLYESLRSLGREADTEVQELRAWRFGFAALALSAVTGGALAQFGGSIPFIATALAFAAILPVCWTFQEPGRASIRATPSQSRTALLAAIRDPILAWLFVLSILMYGFSHLPFVFGQPFILEVLHPLGLEQDAPLVSGGITTAMMVVSLAASLIAPALRRKLGLAAILLCAFGLQVAISYAMTLGGSLGLIFILLLRMVPDSFSRPFILARTQPLLNSNIRATYLSILSLASRIVFAISLAIAAGSATGAAALPLAEIQGILTIYSAIGLASLAALALWARKLRMEPQGISEGS
ncbi:MFS transporter [Pontivivens insulae]|uniref:Major facilitator superfamily (MFS) profile domain-containing protein n=1 Tax=Pontivivens insulae TaxID=1639689 RepID=A0A2R8ACS1_9RHOB|nr:MFS transporter [Pontivivens insulae]RED13950.1 putative MFS family arabinose efflux permease [Pontivivens insulae]SPF30024.1 hypothetical protein POI8812_02352 [Pontivivens insulae]